MRGEWFEARSPLFIDVDLAGNATRRLLLNAAVLGASVVVEGPAGIGDGGAGAPPAAGDALDAGEVVSVPLPAGAWLMLAGLGALVGLHRARV